MSQEIPPDPSKPETEIPTAETAETEGPNPAETEGPNPAETGNPTASETTASSPTPTPSFLRRHWKGLILGLGLLAAHIPGKVRQTEIEIGKSISAKIETFIVINNLENLAENNNVALIQEEMLKRMVEGKFYLHAAQLCEKMGKQQEAKTLWLMAGYQREAQQWNEWAAECYKGAGQSEKANALFSSEADKKMKEGNYSQAARLYLKIGHYTKMRECNLKDADEILRNALSERNYKKAMEFAKRAEKPTNEIALEIAKIELEQPSPHTAQTTETEKSATHETRRPGESSESPNPELINSGEAPGFAGAKLRNNREAGTSPPEQWRSPLAERYLVLSGVSEQDAYLQIAQHAEKRKDFDMAIGYFGLIHNQKKVHELQLLKVKRAEEYNDFMNAGTYYQDLKMPEKAVENFKKAAFQLAQDRKPVQAAELYIKNGFTQEADIIYLKLAKEAEEEKSACKAADYFELATNPQKHLAEASKKAEQAGDYGSAIIYSQRMKDTVRTEALLEKALEQAQEKKEYARAAHYAEALEKPDIAQAMLKKDAEQKLAAGKIEDAIRSYRGACEAKLAKDVLINFVEKAFALEEAKEESYRPREAFDLLEKLEEKELLKNYTLLLREKQRQKGLTALEKRHYHEAYRLLSWRISKRQAGLIVAETAFQNGDIKDAAYHFHYNARDYKRAAEAYQKMDDLAMAASCYEEGQIEVPELWLMVAGRAEDNSKFPFAAYAYGKANKKERSNELWRKAAIIGYYKNQYQEARIYLENAGFTQSQIVNKFAEWDHSKGDFQNAGYKYESLKDYNHAIKSFIRHYELLRLKALSFSSDDDLSKDKDEKKEFDQKQFDSESIAQGQINTLREIIDCIEKRKALESKPALE